MSSGQRVIVGFALAALVIICLGLGWMTGEEARQPASVAQISGRASAPDDDKRRFRTETERCSLTPNYNNAVLCAYLRQADAAERGVWASIVQSLLTFGAILASAAGLLISFRSLRVALDANRQTQRIGEAQARCYLTITKVGLDLRDDLTSTVSVTVKNTGSSPAINVEFDYELFVGNRTGANMVIKSDALPWQTLAQIAAGDEETIDLYVGEPQGDPAELAALKAAQRNLTVACDISGYWEDVFSNELWMQERWAEEAGWRFSPIAIRSMNRVSHTEGIDERDEEEAAGEV
jgi:hypothetical protein